MAIVEPAGTHVSIRSRPEDREKVGSPRRLIARDRFQSAPGPKTGRKRAVTPSRRSPVVVSIRSRPEDREKGRVGSRPPRAGSFQSAPGPKTGRKRRVIEHRAGRPCFNPLPARRPGERGPCRVELRGRVDVSIRSRPEDREKVQCFGPDSAIEPVSIRSRPEDREKVIVTVDGHPGSMFQSAPGPKTGRKSPAGYRQFQSAPARRPGETPIRRAPFQSAPGPKTGRKRLISTPCNERSCVPNPANPIATHSPYHQGLIRIGRNSLGSHLLRSSRKPRHRAGANGSRAVYHLTPLDRFQALNRFRSVPVSIRSPSGDHEKMLSQLSATEQSRPDSNDPQRSGLTRSLARSSRDCRATTAQKINGPSKSTGSLMPKCSMRRRTFSSSG